MSEVRAQEETWNGFSTKTVRIHIENHPIPFACLKGIEGWGESKVREHLERIEREAGDTIRPVDGAKLQEVNQDNSQARLIRDSSNSTDWEKEVFKASMDPKAANCNLIVYSDKLTLMKALPHIASAYLKALKPAEEKKIGQRKIGKFRFGGKSVFPKGISKASVEYMMSLVDKN